MDRLSRASIAGAAIFAALVTLTAACGDEGDDSAQNNNARCGDGVIQEAEQCDDGTANSDQRRDACRTSCLLARCGDGVLDGGELCDEGAWNSDRGDTLCRLNCGPPTCGDGILDEVEECDDGTANSNCLPDACRRNCVAPRCGDGVVDPLAGESCDGGGDECVDCWAECIDCDGDRFGDGPGCVGIDCDDDNFLVHQDCTGGCTPISCPGGCCFAGICVRSAQQNRDFCGTGAEECSACPDDTYCTGSGTCGRPECGNQLADPGEECDGDDLRGWTCASTGQFTGGTLACRSDCTFDVTGCEGLLTCGNGALDPGEACDDGINDGAYGGCMPGCLLLAPFCGNTTRDGTEECDGDDLGSATCHGLGLSGGGVPTCVECRLLTTTCCQDPDGDLRGAHCDLGLDACEADGSNWTSAGCVGCLDSDGDGYRGSGCDQSEDHCDGDVLNWTQHGCASCRDADSDGVMGTDCDDPEDPCDGDVLNWTVAGCANCSDADGDGSRGTLCDASDDCDDSAQGVTGPCQGNGCPQGWILVPAGDFQMGCNNPELDATCSQDERPRHTVTLSAYCVEQTEVSVAEFRACMDASVCLASPTDQATYTWCNFTPTSSGTDDHPINCVTWYESQQYCQSWLGGDLLTEAQWEKAARGNDPDMRKYPWGDAPEPDCGHCNFDFNAAATGEGCSSATSGPGSWPVGSLTSGAGDSPFGLQDMAGNVYEWVQDWYDGNFYDGCTAGCTDPVNTDSTSGLKVRRGSSYANDTTESLRVVFRNSDTPDTRYHLTGLRCQRPPQ